MVHHILKYIIAPCLYLAGGVLQAQVQLSLDSCRTLALENNRQTKTAQEQLQKMQYEVNAYRANFFPRISAQGMYLFTTADFNYHRRFDLYDTSLPGLIGSLPLPEWTSDFLDQLYRSAGVDLDINIKASNTFMAGLMFEQPIFMGGKITTAYKMAKTGQQMAQLNIKRSEAETLLETDRAYWQYVKVAELYHTALMYREAVKSVCNDAKNGVETGMVAENDRMKADVKLGEAELMVRQAGNGKRLAQMNLCKTIGLNMLTPVAPLDTLPDNYAADLPATLPEVSARTEYSLLKKQLELKNLQVNMARSGFLPQLSVAGGYNYLNGVTMNDVKLFEKASFTALVSLKIPITQWYEGTNRIRSAKADLRMAEYQTQETIDLLQLEMFKVYYALDEAILKTGIALRDYQQTQENLRILNDRYELGMETLSSLLEAQALWQQAWSKYVEAKADLRVAESDYLRVTE
jgi:outer membrane protein TolC